MLNVKFDTSNLLRNLPQINEKIKERVKSALRETAMVDVETPAKRQCRVDTGRLRASIHTEYFGNSGKFTIAPKHDLEVIVGTNVDYGRYVERRYPFLFPAFESSRSALLQRLKNALKDI